MNDLIIFCAKYLIIVPVLVWIFVFWRLKLSKRLLALTVLAGFLALVASRVASHLFYDPRPFVNHSVKPLISHSADNGFPSDHTLLAATLSSVIYFFDRKLAAISFAATLLVSLGRIGAHVHSPIDIIGSLVIAVAAAWLAQYLVDRYKNQKTAPKR